jgi:hypothetical protein
MSELSMVISFSLKGKRQIDTDGWYPNRHGAEVARGAHNSEVIRSKRIAGIFYIE